MVTGWAARGVFAGVCRAASAVCPGPPPRSRCPPSARGQEGDEQGDAVVRAAGPEEREQGGRGAPHPGRAGRQHGCPWCEQGWGAPGTANGHPAAAHGQGVLRACFSFQYARKEQEDEGRKRYEEQKLDRLETKQRNGDVIMPVINPGNADPAGSACPRVSPFFLRGLPWLKEGGKHLLSS